MSLWVIVTLCAACLQVIRTGLQKSLTHDVDNVSGTWIRYIYAMPFVPFLFAAVFFVEEGIPSISLSLLVYCLAASVTQIVATILLLTLFQHRSFAASAAFAKTEGLQVALLGVLVFAEPPSALGWLGICLGTFSVLLLCPWRQLTATGKVIGYGLGAGFLFALTVWLIRSSYQEVQAGTFAAALLILAIMVTLQSLLLGIYLYGRRVNFATIWHVRQRAAGVGVSSLIGSLCWFWAFGLTNPAYVKVLAQVELPLAFFLGRTVFSERTSVWEISGMTIACVSAVIICYA